MKFWKIILDCPEEEGSKIVGCACWAHFLRRMIDDFALIHRRFFSPLFQKWGVARVHSKTPRDREENTVCFSQREGKYTREEIAPFGWRRGAVFWLRACGSCLPFFSPKTAPKSKVWRGHLRQGSQDFIDSINGLGNFRGILGLIHPDHAVFH